MRPEREREEVEEGETDLRAWAMAEGVLARRLLVSVLTVGFNTYVEDDGSSSSPPCGAAGRAHTVFLVATIDGGSRHPRAMHPALCAFSRGRWTGEGAGGDGGAKGERRRRGDWGRDGKGIGGETTWGSAARVFHSWGAAYIQQT